MAHTPDDPAVAQVWVTKGLDELDFEFYIPQGPKGDPGGITSTIVPQNTDIDQYVSAGFYSITAATDTSAAALAHMPINEAGTLMVTASNTNSNQIQTFLTNTKSIYKRRKFSGSWSAWVHFGWSRTDQTAGRAMYHWDELNGREQLVYGDTGARSVVADQAWVDALTGTGLALAGSQLARVRRVGNVVELAWAFDKTATGSVTCTAAFPAGFRPAALFNALAVTSSMGLTRAYHGGGTSLMIYQSGNTVQSNTTASLTYLTNDAWPTALPGTAIGTIPAT